MDRGMIWPGVVVALVLITGFVALAGTGHDTTAFIVFVSGPLVSTLVGLFLAGRVAPVKKLVEDIHHQTNALLTERLDSLDGQLTAAHVERATIASVQPEQAHDAGIV